MAANTWEYWKPCQIFGKEAETDIGYMDRDKVAKRPNQRQGWSEGVYLGLKTAPKDTEFRRDFYCKFGLKLNKGKDCRTC